MNPIFLAVALLKTKTDPSTGLEKTEVDFQEVVGSVLLKFIDVLEGVVIIILGIFVMRYLKRYFEKIATTHERQRTALNLLEKIISGFIIIVAFTFGLKVIGLDLTLLLSVLTLGLSFGLRDVIKNYIAGLLILFKSPFEIGDVVHIRAFTGKVEKIEFQAVTLRTFDNKMVTIHNSDLLTQPITNYSKTQQARLEIHVPLGYGSDTGRALKIFERVLENHEVVLKSPKYSIVFKSFDSKSVNVLIRFWVQKPCNVLRIRSELALQIGEAFDEENIIVPYTREAELPATAGMTENRKARLQAFYAQPLLSNGGAAAHEGLSGVEAAGVEAGRIEAAALSASENGGAAATPGTAPALAEIYVDTEEPE